MGNFIPFGEWLPDLPDFENPGATVATNVIPDAKSYLSFPNTTVYSTSLGGRCQGAFIARDLAGNQYNYAGDASALYVMVGTSWSNVSRLVGGAYTTATDDYWEYTQFGAQLIAVNGANTDAPQAITVGAANFAALAGSPPKARHIATVRDFVVMGNISATATSPQMVRWSAINNATSWTPDAATLADFQDLPGDGGWIQKIIGGEYGTIFQERAIYRMTFVGSPLVFQFDKVHTNIGAYAPQSVVNYRNFTFFLSEDGFYMFDGSNVQPIGQNKVDRTFFAELDTGYTYRVQAAINPRRKIVAWAYPASGNVGGNPNRLLIYHWGNQRWSKVEGLNVQLILQSITGAYTLESLDNLSTNIDSLMVPFDSIFYSGGNYLFSCFDSSNRLNLFNGSAMAAEVETVEVQPNRGPDGLTYVTEVRPVAEGLSASVSLTVAARNVLTQSATYTTAVQPNSTGFAPVRATGRFLRFKLTTSNNSAFDHLQGVDISSTPDGVR